MNGRPHRVPTASTALASVGTSPRVDPAGRWVVAAVAAVLAAEHTGAPVAPVGPVPDGVLDAVVAHRVTTLLADHATALGLDDEVAAGLEAARYDDVVRGLAMIVHTRAMSDTLTAAGVDHLVVKGTALASMVGRGAATRGSGDIDTWVRPADLGVAEAALADVGWTRPPDAAGLPAVGAGWRWEVVARMANELSLGHSQRSTVDLHWRLAVDGGEPGFGFEQALGASEVVSEVGPGVRTLGAEHALAHVAQHARKEHFAIVRQCVDLVDSARRCGPEACAALAARDPNVALALEVVAPFAPWLDPPAASRWLRKLAGEVRAEVGSLCWTQSSLRAVRGMDRLPSRLRRESWLVRSSPTPGAVARHVGRTLVPLRLLVDTAPLRHRRHRG